MVLLPTPTRSEVPTTVARQLLLALRTPRWRSSRGSLAIRVRRRASVRSRSTARSLRSTKPRCLASPRQENPTTRTLADTTRSPTFSSTSLTTAPPYRSSSITAYRSRTPLIFLTMGSSPLSILTEWKRYTLDSTRRWQDSESTKGGKFRLRSTQTTTKIRTTRRQKDGLRSPLLRRVITSRSESVTSLSM